MSNLLIKITIIKRDLIFGGRGFFAGTGTGIVTVAGQPAVRQVMAIDRDTFRVVRSVWSADDGSYRLNHLNPERDYMVMAVDHLMQYEPVVWDFVRPAVDDALADNTVAPPVAGAP